MATSTYAKMNHGMTLKDIREAFAPGQQVKVTNHYITRPDHPCYGTQTRTVSRVTSSHLWFTESGSVQWPNRSQIIAIPGMVQLFGGGIGQQPTDMFLTIEVVR